LKILKASEPADDWPKNFPKNAEVTCTVCAAQFAIDSPRDFTVKHQPMTKGEKRHIAPPIAGEPEPPFDPHHDKWIIGYDCPACGNEQIAEV
jgi:hypothetical protein